jgi:hypothetical protein
VVLQSKCEELAWRLNAYPVDIRNHVPPTYQLLNWAKRRKAAKQKRKKKKKHTQQLFPPFACVSNEAF